MTQEERITSTVRAMTDMVNYASRNGGEFNRLMSREHRTLQQSFTRLCLEWIEHCASEGYQTDPRNESSKWIAQKLIKPIKEEAGLLPSQYLNFV
jgi:hypothetical protein